MVAENENLARVLIGAVAAAVDFGKEGLPADETFDVTGLAADHTAIARRAGGKEVA